MHPSPAIAITPIASPAIPCGVPVAIAIVPVAPPAIPDDQAVAIAVSHLGSLTITLAFTQAQLLAVVAAPVLDDSNIIVAAIASLRAVVASAVLGNPTIGIATSAGLGAVVALCASFRIAPRLHGRKAHLLALGAGLAPTTLLRPSSRALNVATGARLASATRLGAGRGTFAAAVLAAGLGARLAAAAVLAASLGTAAPAAFNLGSLGAAAAALLFRLRRRWSGNRQCRNSGGQHQSVHDKLLSDGRTAGDMRRSNHPSLLTGSLSPQGEPWISIACGQIN